MHGGRQNLLTNGQVIVIANFRTDGRRASSHSVVSFAIRKRMQLKPTDFRVETLDRRLRHRFAVRHRDDKLDGHVMRLTTPMSPIVPHSAPYPRTSILFLRTTSCMSTVASFMG